MKSVYFIRICFFLFGCWGHATRAQTTVGPAPEKAMPANVVTERTSARYELSPHPRFFFPKEEEQQVLQKAKSNGLLRQLIATLKKDADEKLTAAPQVYQAGVQLLAVSREQVARLLNLSLAWRLFREPMYAKKVEEELIHVSNFPSWHPEHFLDVAEMTTAVAIGYDWCYDQLSDSTRNLVETAIREKGFGPAWPLYETTERTAFNRENNWNMVCNTGMLMGAIAIGDKYPDDLDRILKYAVKYTPRLLESFAPEGVFNEGPGYWGYNGMYMSMFFDILKRNIHDDFGLPNFKGLDNTARFYSSLIGPSRNSYNFGDAAPHENIDYSGTLFFLSRLYKQPAIAAFYRKLIAAALHDYHTKGINEFTRFFFLSIPWFNEAKLTTQVTEEKLTVFHGVTDFLFFNGDKSSNQNRLWLAAKTGRPAWSHNQLDVGSFVVDADGERWGIDLGPDNYSLPDFWDYKPGGVRWRYFRNSNLSHNTISIDDQIANSGGQGELTRFSTDASHPFGIFDLSPAYPDQVLSALRGFRLLSPDALLIRDEITVKPGSKKVAWRFLTNARVKIDGGTATLTQNNKTFYLQCLLPNGFALTAFPAKTNSTGEKPVKGVTIIEITVYPSNGKTTIPVVIGKNVAGIKRNFAGNLALKDWK